VIFRLSLNPSSRTFGESGSTIHDVDACCPYDAISQLMLKLKPKGLNFIHIAYGTIPGNSLHHYCAEYTDDVNADFELSIYKLRR